MTLLFQLPVEEPFQPDGHICQRRLLRLPSKVFLKAAFQIHEAYGQHAPDAFDAPVHTLVLHPPHH